MSLLQMQILELDTVQRAFGNKAVLGFDVCITEQVRILECIKNKGGNEFLSKLYMNTQDTELYVNRSKLIWRSELET